MKKSNRFISSLLAVSMLTATVGALEIQPSQEIQPESTVTSVLSDFLLNKIDQDISDISSIVEAPAAESASPADEMHLMNEASAGNETDEPENTNNELKLELTDGTYSLYSFSEDIKFTDENGAIRYKDTAIVPQTDKALKKEGYTYTNGTNDYRMNFSPAVDKGVLTEYDGVKIGFIPIPTSEDYTKSGGKTTFMLDGESVDSFEYPALYGEGSILRYTAQLNALKKDIILPEYTGQNTFRFILDTYGNTAVLGEDGKTVQILHAETGEVLRTLAPIYAYDSFGGTYSDDFHYTEDCHYTLSLREDGRYDMGVAVSEEYLSNPALIYPVTIDPSGVSISNLQDAPVYSSQATKNWGGSTTMCFGRSSTNGSGRCYIKFNIASIGSNANVTSATLTLRETTGRTTSTTTGIYMASGSWTETGLTWNNKPGYSSLQSSLNINSPGGNYFYNFNVKSAVQQWANGTANNGFAIVSNDENNTSNYWRAFATKEYSTSSYRPVLRVDYENYATISEGFYHIKNKWTGKYLDVQNPGGTTSSIVNVIVFTFTGAGNQQWKIVSQGNGWYKFYTMWPFSDLKCLDVTGDNIDVFDDGNGDYLLFRLISNGDGTYRIMPKAYENTTNVLDVHGNPNEPSDYKKNVISYPWANSDNQKWTFEKVNFGCGGSYRPIGAGTPARPDCMGYSLTMANPSVANTNVGLALSGSSYYTEDHIQDIENGLRKYVNCRRLENFSAPINSNEYRIAIRTPNGYNGWRFHVIYQLSDGTWVGKNYTYASKKFNQSNPFKNVNPDNSPDMWDGDSIFPARFGTVYYAISSK